MTNYVVSSCSPANPSASPQCGSYVCSDTGFSSVEKQKNNWTSCWQGCGIHKWDFEHQTHWLENLGLELHGCLSADFSKCAWICRMKWLGPAEFLLHLRAEFEFFYQSSLLGKLAGLYWNANGPSRSVCEWRAWSRVQRWPSAECDGSPSAGFPWVGGGEFET